MDYKKNSRAKKFKIYVKLSAGNYSEKNFRKNAFSKYKNALLTILLLRKYFWEKHILKILGFVETSRCILENLKKNFKILVYPGKC